MKVCLLNDSFPPVIDGVANVVMNYAAIMQEEGLAEVCVGTPGYPEGKYDGYPYKVIPYDSFDTTKVAFGYRAGNPLDIKELKAMTDFEPDIIHAHSPASATIVARLLRFQTDAPVVYTYHTKYDIDIANAVKSKLLQKEVIKAMVNNIEACDEVWVVSKGAGENLRSLGFQGDYRVMNNGVDFARGRVPAEDVAKATEGYDLPEGVPVFLFVGRMMEYKGLPMIIDALAKLSADGTDFRMVFIGSGADEEAMKAKAAALLKPEQYIFTGAIRDRDILRAWNTRADLFLFPSTFDTNGLVVREAAACGLASVLVRNSCASEGVQDNHNGFLIDENADSMYELLKVVSRDLEHVHDVGKNAMEELYISWQDSVHQAHERYGEILDLKRSGALPFQHSTLPGTLRHHEEEKEKLQDEYDKLHEEREKRLEAFREELRREYHQARGEMAEDYEKVRDFFHDMIDKFDRF